MVRWTEAEWAAVWNDAPGLPNGRYYWMNKTPDGMTAAHDYDATTFGICLEHDKVGGAVGERCTVYVIDGAREADVGFHANNTITVSVQGMTTDPIDCKDCDLFGRIRRGTWEFL